MSLITDLVGAKDQILADAAILHAVVSGPAAGAGSLVEVAPGQFVRTLRRLAIELVDRESVAAVSIVGGVVNIDLLATTIFTIPLTANITSLLLSAIEAGHAGSFILEFTADGTQRTVAQPGNVVPMNGTYTPSAGNGKKDRLLYESIDGGTTWRMWIVFQNQ